MLRLVNFEINILTWYNTTIGIATIIWLATSGGVIIAARTKTNTSAYFLYLTRDSGVTTPALVKKYIIIGNSKIIPEAIAEDLTKLIKEPKSISLST